MNLRLPVLLLLCVTSLLRADEPSVEPMIEPTIETALQRRLISPELPLKEVQEFSETRIPPMPNVRSSSEWETFAQTMRERTLKNVVLRGAAAEWAVLPTQAEYQETIDAAPEYVIKKLRFEAVPGMWIPALLYEPKSMTGKVPVVMNVNGHDAAGKAAEYKQLRCINLAKRGMLVLNLEWVGMGQLRTPGFGHYKMNQLDLCGTSGLAPFYLSMQRGIDVLLAHPQADPSRVAVSGLSGGGWQTIFISSLDPRVTLTNPVAGYSSFKTRARFQSDLGDSEQTPSDLATETDYALLTAMMAPRATLLTNNAQDLCCFKAEHAQPPLVDASAPIFDLYQKSAWLRTHVNHDPGSHNFDRDNREQLYKMIGDHFFGGLTPVLVRLDREKLKQQGMTVTALRLSERFIKFDPQATSGLLGELNAKIAPDVAAQTDYVVLISRHFEHESIETLGESAVRIFDSTVPLKETALLTEVRSEFANDDYTAVEIPSEAEVKTADELAVQLPEVNHDFHSLAVQLMESLPVNGELPGDRSAAGDWLQTKRTELRRLVSAHHWEVRGLLEQEEVLDGVTVRHWWLRIGGLWTVPATEFVPANADGECVLLCSEQGRGTLGDEVRRQLELSHRVVAFDPYYFGESKINQRDFLYGLLVAATGQRNLGILASQMNAIAEWAGQSLKTSSVTLGVVGPRLSVAALVATGVESRRIHALELHHPYASLKEIITQDLGVNQAPELFCFGLLKEFDVPQLVGLSSCRQLTFKGDATKLNESLAALMTEKRPIGPGAIVVEELTVPVKE